MPNGRFFRVRIGRGDAKFRERSETAMKMCLPVSIEMKIGVVRKPCGEIAASLRWVAVIVSPRTSRVRKHTRYLEDIWYN